MTKCCFPACQNDIANGAKLRNDRYLCIAHGEDWYFVNAEIERQAAIVSALAAAVNALGVIDAAVDCEMGRLIAMQSRRIEYLKAAGFDRVNEGV